METIEGSSAPASTYATSRRSLNAASVSAPVPVGPGDLLATVEDFCCTEDVLVPPPELALCRSSPAAFEPACFTPRVRR